MRRLPLNYLIVILLIIIGFGLYAASFANQMFWDDDDFILKNQFVKNGKVAKFFSENLIAGAGLLSNYWRPMLLSVFSLEWRLWGDWAGGYHFVNTSFHIADAILLFFILIKLFKNRPLAFLTTLIFLIHPLQTEAVTYVSGLGDSLSVFFIFLGILFWLKFRFCGKKILQSPFYCLSLVMYLFALMSKETAIVMPALIIIVDFFFLRRKMKSLKERFKKNAEAIWPFFALAGVYILLRATVLNFLNTFNLYNEENVFTLNLHVRLFTFFRVLVTYFRLLFWPTHLHMERTVEIATNPFSASVILGGIIFFGFLILAFKEFKRFPILSFGIFWFFITLAPTSNILIPISGLLYEHWLYLPMIGIFLILIWLIITVMDIRGPTSRILMREIEPSPLNRTKKHNLGKIPLGCFIVFLVFFSVLTIQRNQDWRDPVTFYNQTLKYAPTSYRVINNLGMAYSDRGDFEEAEETYKRAINLAPSNPVAYHNLGNLYRDANKYDLAVENFNKAIELDPNFIFSYNALISLYLENKDYKKAQEILEEYRGLKK